MFSAAKIACSGIVFLLMAPWISGPCQTPLQARTTVSSGVPGGAPSNDITLDVNKVQQILQDKGHYRGNIDGVFGLRTRASIRGFQKAENLPVTGDLDVQTAGKLGVRPDVRAARDYETSQNKPSAGTKRATGSRRFNPLRKRVMKSALTVPPG